MELPAGLRAVAVTESDLPELLALWRTCEAHDAGEALITEEDLRSVWARPSFVAERDAVGVRAGAELAGWAALFQPGRADVFVAPAWRGRGIGTALLRWTEQVATARGDRRVGQYVFEQAADARALLAAHGYTERWTSWMLARTLDGSAREPELPPGYAIRGFERGRDERTTYELIEAAFSEWPGRPRETFEDWSAEVIGRSDFDPAWIALCVHGDAVVGARVDIYEEGDDLAWVHQLAVARAHRGRGLGRALLQHCFAAAWARGRRRCGLATDTRTGALALYRQVGMEVTRTELHLARELE